MFFNQVGSYRAKDTLNGKCSREKLLRYTPDVSVFILSWSRPLWCYNSTPEFPRIEWSPDSFKTLLIIYEVHFLYHSLSKENVIPQYLCNILFGEESTVTSKLHLIIEKVSTLKLMILRERISSSEIK